VRPASRAVHDRCRAPWSPRCGTAPSRPPHRLAFDLGQPSSVSTWPARMAASARRLASASLFSGCAHPSSRRPPHHHHADGAPPPRQRARGKSGAAALRAALFLRFRSPTSHSDRVHCQADCQHARDQRGIAKFRSPGAHVPPVVRRREPFA
jgi:hypothetical protein